MEKLKGGAWSTSAENLLLELWSQSIDAIRGCGKNTDIYQEMSAHITALGFGEISATDINIKINKMTAKYMKCKHLMDVSGASAADWVHYNAVHKIIGSFPINNTTSIVEESIYCYTPDFTDPISSPLPAAYPLPSPSPQPSESAVLSLSPSMSPQSAASSLLSPLASPSTSSERSDVFLKFCSTMERTMEQAVDWQQKMAERFLAIEQEKLKICEEIKDDTKKITSCIMAMIEKQN